MPEIYGKVWGETMPIFFGNNVEVHRISAIEGGASSWHHHASKANAFFVESGMLRIEVEKSYGLIDETYLGPGQKMTVKPGEVHRFVAVEDTVAYEIYWVTLDPDDIVRRTVGGLINQQKPESGVASGSVLDDLVSVTKHPVETALRRWSDKNDGDAIY